ncbi:MAG: RluA family pseudouridine synthase [Myxococcales bacterium]|nr:RluA family pseudouridine synthase [Myxococcales bacterium]MCB9732638.1 RluA family pseudouridine synthase [Deltaproteobacteria bacterium]
MTAAAPAVLAVDGALWALAKPSGLVVHRTNDPDRDDLLSWCVREAGAPTSLCAVHRLDAETSGVVLCAADARLAAELGALFAAHAVRKTYLALVVGRPHQRGTIDRALPDARRGEALPAVTRYATEERLGGFTLLRVEPETGRKHQIRRHLHGVGHPLVGDTRYRPRRFRPVPGFPGRLWLHALRVALPDGRAFEAPLPGELAAHLAVLRGGAG